MPGLVAVLVTVIKVSSLTVTLVCAGNIGGVFQQEALGQLETVIVSIHQPTNALPLSVPQLQRNWMFWPEAEAGRSTVVVMNPPELPLQADMPAKGLPKFVSVVTL